MPGVCESVVVDVFDMEDEEVSLKPKGGRKVDEAWN